MEIEVQGVTDQLQRERRTWHYFQFYILLKQRNPGGFIWEVICVHTGKSVRGPHTGVVCLLTEYIPEYTQLKIMVQEEKLLDTVWAELSSRSHV